MGREGAKLFHTKGWRVAAIDRDDDGLNTPDRSDGRTMTREELQARAPKKGMFRLMPASSVAEAAWRAYQHPTRLHWYVPESIRWIDRIKGLSPEWTRRQIVKSLPKITGEG